MQAVRGIEQGGTFRGFAGPAAPLPGRRGPGPAWGRRPLRPAGARRKGQPPPRPWQEPPLAGSEGRGPRLRKQGPAREQALPDRPESAHRRKRPESRLSLGRAAASGKERSALPLADGFVGDSHLIGQLQLGHPTLLAQGRHSGTECLFAHRVCTPLICLPVWYHGFPVEATDHQFGELDRWFSPAARVGPADVGQDICGLVHQLVRAGGGQLLGAPEPPYRPQGGQAGVVAVAMSTLLSPTKRVEALDAPAPHQAVQAAGSGLTGTPGRLPHRRKEPGAK